MPRRLVRKSTSLKKRWKQGKELESITGDSKTLQKNREEVASKAAEIRLRIVSLQKDVEANTDEITRLKNRKTGHLDRLSELDGEIREIEEKNDELRALTERLSADEKALKANHGDAQNQINELISQRDELEKQANDLRLHERAKSEERERLSGDIARLEERKIAMRNEYDNLTSKLYDEYQLTRREAAALEIEIDDYSLAAKRLAELKSQIRALGSVNVSAIEEYKEVSERYEFLSGQISDVETSRAELNKMIDDLTGKWQSSSASSLIASTHASGRPLLSCSAEVRRSFDSRTSATCLAATLKSRFSRPAKRSEHQLALRR